VKTSYELSYKINGKGRNARDIRQNMGERILIPLTGKKAKNFIHEVDLLDSSWSV